MFHLLFPLHLLFLWFLYCFKSCSISYSFHINQSFIYFFSFTISNFLKTCLTYQQWIYFFKLFKIPLFFLSSYPTSSNFIYKFHISFISSYFHEQIKASMAFPFITSYDSHSFISFLCVLCLSNRTRKCSLLTARYTANGI